MLSLQRSTAALTGVLLLAASLSAGVHPAVAQSVQPSPIATQEPAVTSPVATQGPVQSPEPQDVSPAESTTGEVVPVEAVPAEVATVEEAPAEAADIHELFPDGFPAHPDHTFEGPLAKDGHSFTSTTEGAAMSPLGAGGTLSRAGDIKVRLVTVDLADSTATVPRTTAENSIAVSSKYWRSMSNGRLSMSVA